MLVAVHQCSGNTHVFFLLSISLSCFINILCFTMSYSMSLLLLPVFFSGSVGRSVSLTCHFLYGRGCTHTGVICITKYHHVMGRAAFVFSVEFSWGYFLLDGWAHACFIIDDSDEAMMVVAPRWEGGASEHSMIPGWDKEGWRTYIFGRHKACFGCILYHVGRFSLIDDAFGNVIVILFLYNVPNNPMHNVSSI